MNITGHAYFPVIKDGDSNVQLIPKSVSGIFTVESYPDNSYNYHWNIFKGGGSADRSLMRFDASKNWTGEKKY